MLCSNAVSKVMSDSEFEKPLSDDYNETYITA